jgi:hypothetical protein
MLDWSLEIITKVSTQEREEAKNSSIAAIMIICNTLNYHKNSNTNFYYSFSKAHYGEYQY